jgi:hypothetical protein
MSGAAVIPLRAQRDTGTQVYKVSQLCSQPLSLLTWVPVSACGRTGMTTGLSLAQQPQE